MLARTSAEVDDEWSADDLRVVDEILQRASLVSARDVLYAAAVSPTAVHRLPSAVTALARCLQLGVDDNTASGSADAEVLLSAARSAWAALPLAEDFYPADPRLTVRFGYRSDRFLVHPGTTTNALGQLDALCARASAADALIRARVGFGLDDLIEVGLHYSDAGMREFATVWDDRERPSPACGFNEPDRFLLADQIAVLPATVSEAEVLVAAHAGIWMDRAIESCSDPASARRALDWATGDGDRLVMQMLNTRARWGIGPILAIQSGDSRWPLPLSCVVEGLIEAEVALLSLLTAAREQAALAAALTAVAVADFNRACAGVQAPVVQDHDAPDQADLRWQADNESMTEDLNGETGQLLLVLPIAERHALVVDVVAGWAIDSMASICEKVIERSEGRTVAELQQAGAPIVDDCELVRVVLCTGPVRPMRPHQQGAAVLMAIEDLSAMISEATCGPESLEEVLRFLIDMTTPGPVTIRGVEILDVWRHWRDHKGLASPELGPSGEIAVVVDWQLHDETWQVAAEWEPTDAVLDAVCLPPARLHARRLLDREVNALGCATLWPPGPATVYFLAPPCLVVVAGIDDGLPATADPEDAAGLHRVSGELGVQLAGSIRDLLAELGIASALIEPLRVSVEIVARGLIAAAVEDVVRHVRIGIGLDWVMSTAADAPRAHTALGECVINALAPSLPSETVARARSAWQSRPPVLAAQVERTGIPPAIALPGRMPTGPHYTAAAWRSLAATVTTEIEPGQYESDDASALCRRVLHSAAQNALLAAIKQFGPARVMMTTLRELDARLADITNSRSNTSLNLAGPWRESTRAQALLEPDDTMVRQGLATVVEFALVAATQGRTPEHTKAQQSAQDASGVEPVAGLPVAMIDRFDLASLVGLTEQVILTGVIAYASAQAAEHLVLVSPSGAIAIAPANRDSDSPTTTSDSSDRRDGTRVAPRSAGHVNLHAWNAAVIADVHRMSSPTLSTSVMDDMPAHYQPMLAELPPRWRTLDTALHQHMDTSLDAVMVVLGTAESVALNTGDAAVTTTDALLGMCLEWAPTVSTEAISAAIDLLTLTPEALIEDDLQTWELERRAHRLATRPLVAVGTSLVTTAHLARMTRTLLTRNLALGKVIWPDAPRPVHDAANRIRQQVTRSLEDLVATALAETDLRWAVRITPQGAASVGLHIRREVDAVALDVKSHRLWVIEAKDLAPPYSRSAISKHVRQYTDQHVPAHQERVASIRAQITAAMRLLSIQPLPQVDRLDVVGLVVTRTPSPAAFVSQPALTYVVIDDLVDLLTSSDEPSPGHWPIGMWQWNPTKPGERTSNDC